MLFIVLYYENANMQMFASKIALLCSIKLRIK